jgi:hypothetical protein
VSGDQHRGVLKDGAEHGEEGGVRVG